MWNSPKLSLALLFAAAIALIAPKASGISAL